MKGMLDLTTGRRRKTTPLEADGVQSNEPCPIACHHRKWRSIERELRPTRSHHRLPHPRILMEPGIGAENREIIHLCMPSESTEAGDDRLISDLAIMPDMGTIHHIIVVSDSRAAAAASRADVNRDVLSDLCSQTDLETGRLAVEGSVLGFGPKARVREDSAIRPDMRATEKRDVRAHFDPRPEFDLASDEGEGPDHHIGGQNRSVFDTCGRVDRGQELNPYR
jgi:hypothetical protein